MSAKGTVSSARSRLWMNFYLGLLRLFAWSDGSFPLTPPSPQGKTFGRFTAAMRDYWLVATLHEPMRAERENSETPLGVAMSIEDDTQRIVSQFPANFPVGNWQEIARRVSSVGGRSIDIATPKGVSESAQMTTGVGQVHGRNAHPVLELFATHEQAHQTNRLTPHPRRRRTYGGQAGPLPVK